MNSPAISVIIPVYNAAEYLRDCLDSILSQTVQSIEIICVNDGSTDGSSAILAEYASLHQKTLKVLNKPNGGAASARNAGLEAALGEYIIFLDADDTLLPDMLKKLCNSIRDTGSDIAVCGFYRILAQSGKVVSTEMTKARSPLIKTGDDESSLAFINTAPWNKLIRARLLKGIRFEQVRIEDLLFNIELFFAAEKISFVTQPLYRYMTHENSEITSLSPLDFDVIVQRLAALRSKYEGKAADRRQFYNQFDLTAFIHLGISLTLRMSYRGDCRMPEVISKTKGILDAYFPCWAKNRYLKAGYLLTHFSVKLFMLKILVLMYKTHTFIVFLKLYRLMLDKLKIDVKW